MCSHFLNFQYLKQAFSIEAVLQDQGFERATQKTRGSAFWSLSYIKNNHLNGDTLPN